MENLVPWQKTIHKVIQVPCTQDWSQTKISNTHTHTHIHTMSWSTKIWSDSDRLYSISTGHLSACRKHQSDIYKFYWSGDRCPTPKWAPVVKVVVMITTLKGVIVDWFTVCSLQHKLWPTYMLVLQWSQYVSKLHATHQFGLFFFFFFFLCVPQLYLWGSPLLGEIFCVCDRFLIQPLR